MLLVVAVILCANLELCTITDCKRLLARHLFQLVLVVSSCTSIDKAHTYSVTIISDDGPLSMLLVVAVILCANLELCTITDCKRLLARYLFQLVIVVSSCTSIDK